MVLPKPLRLPAEALARLVALENLGELHVTLKPPAMWRPKQVEHEVETRTRAEFARMGLFDRRGRLEIELVASLTVVCRPGVEFYGWINHGDNTLGVLAGAIGREAILAIRDGDSVWLQQIRPESLPEALVAQTADVQPGRGEAFNLLQSEALASVGGRQRTEAGVGTRPAAPEIRLAQKLAELPTTAGGQLYVAVRDGLGRRRATEQPLRRHRERALAQPHDRAERRRPPDPDRPGLPPRSRCAASGDVHITVPVGRPWCSPG